MNRFDLPKLGIGVGLRTAHYQTILSEQPAVDWFPTLRLCRFDFPVNDFFQSFKDGRSPRAPRPAPQDLAVYRQGFTLWRMVLRPAMARLLRSLALGVPLGKALSEVEASATEPLAAAVVMAWFSAWVQAGFFRAIELPGADP